ncbi:hypothetical protein [Sphingobacterium siyangense]
MKEKTPFDFERFKEEAIVYIGYSGPSLSLEYRPPVSVITDQQL